MEHRNKGLEVLAPYFIRIHNSEEPAHRLCALAASLAQQALNQDSGLAAMASLYPTWVGRRNASNSHTNICLQPRSLNSQETPASLVLNNVNKVTYNFIERDAERV